MPPDCWRYDASKTRRGPRVTPEPSQTENGRSGLLLVERRYDTVAQRVGNLFFGPLVGVNVPLAQV